MSLQEIAVGEHVRVQSVGGARDVRRRLMEMGLLPGTSLRVVRRAPMGDPIELQLRGYSLSIRGTEAKAIEVEAIEVEVMTTGLTTARAAE